MPLVLTKLIIPKQHNQLLDIKSEAKKCHSSPSLILNTLNYGFFKIHIQDLPSELLHLILEYVDQNCLVNRFSVLNRFFNNFVLKNPLTCVQVWHNRRVLFGNDKKSENWLRFYAYRIFGAIQMIQTCQISHLKFSYLSPEHFGLILQVTRSYLRQIHVQWCEGSNNDFIVDGSDDEEEDQMESKSLVEPLKTDLKPLAVLSLLSDHRNEYNFPFLTTIQLEFYETGASSIVEQLLNRVIPRAPKLKRLDGIKMSLPQYDRLMVNWNELSSVTVFSDGEGTDAIQQSQLDSVSLKLSNSLESLDLKAEHFHPEQVRKMLNNTAAKLSKLIVEDLLPINMGEIKLDQLAELNVHRSERAVCNLVKSMPNLNTLVLDRGSSYEILAAAAFLKNLKHLTIERYGASLTQIMKHCSLESLQIAHIDMDASLLNCLVLRGQSITLLKMDHVKFSNSDEVDSLFSRLKNLKSIEMNVCHTASNNSTTTNSNVQRYGVSSFYYGRSRMGLDVNSFATPNLQKLTYQKAMREKTCGIRMSEFHYLTQQCPKLNHLDISLFDVAYTPTASATKFNVFPDLDSCYLTFGEFASLSHMCCVLICCRNATQFAVNSITCKAAYIDALRVRLMNEINLHTAAIKTARPLSPIITPKKLKRGCEQRLSKPKKSTHSKKGTCGLKQLASILWSEMEEHVFGHYQFYENGRDVTDELRKFYRAELVLRFNPKQSRKNDALLHQFLYVLQLRILSTDIPKKKLIYGPTL